MTCKLWSLIPVLILIIIEFGEAKEHQPDFHALEGDILIDGPVDKFIDDKLKHDDAIIKRRRFKRNAIKDTRFRWPGGIIPYTFDLPRRDWELKVRKAMDFLEDKTCVKFVNWTGIERQYVRITAYNSGERGCMLHGTGRGTPFPPQYRGGCWSAVGRQYDYVGQVVCYGENANCLVSCQQEIIHELLHVTGLYHEHSRFDRDDYLYIHRNNIEPNVYKDAFKKYTRKDVDHYGEEYDYTSVLHYQWNAFAKDKASPTMTATKNWAPKLVHPCYQTHSASPSDVRKVNKMYQCQKLARLNQLNTRVIPHKLRPITKTSQNTWPQIANDDSIRSSKNPFAETDVTGRCTVKHDIIIPGNYMRKYLQVNSHGECCEICRSTPNCKAWNWLAGTASCYLKSALGGTSSPLKGSAFGQVVNRIRYDDKPFLKYTKPRSINPWNTWNNTLYRRYIHSGNNWRIQQTHPIITRYP